MLTEMIEGEPGASCGHHVIAHLMRITYRPDFPLGFGKAEARLDAAQHHRRMHPGDDDVTGWPANAMHLAEQFVQVFDMIHDERAQDTIEILRRERQRLEKIVQLKADIGFSGFCACLLQHSRQKIQAGDARSSIGHANGMTTCSATKVENIQTLDVTE